MTEEKRPSETGRHGAYIGDRPYDSSERVDECGEDDACEGLRAIEVQFAIPVTMTQDRQKQLHDWVEALVYEPFNQPKEGVHWPGFVGGRLTYSDVDSALLGRSPSEDPDKPAAGEEPHSEDDVFVIGTSERAFGWEKERERVLAEREERYSRHDDSYTRGTECRLRGAPPELKRFIEGVRYYLNTLEDEDAWWHSLGHIEELCKEFDQAVKARSEASK